MREAGGFQPRQGVKDYGPTTSATPAPSSQPDFADDLSALTIPPETPTCAESLGKLRGRLAKLLVDIDDKAAIHVQKLFNAAERSFTNCLLLDDENFALSEQNREKATRKTVKNIVVGCAKVMSYEDIQTAQQRRSEKEASTSHGKNESVGCRTTIRETKTVVEPRARL